QARQPGSDHRHQDQHSPQAEAEAVDGLGLWVDGHSMLGAHFPRAQKKSRPQTSPWPALNGSCVLNDSLVEETGQLLAAAGLLQLADGLGFDLANTFAGHFENVTDFFQRVAVAV